MSWGAVIVGGAALIGGLVSSNASKQAAKGAANAQKEAALAGIGEQTTQWQAIQKMLSPYVQAGTGALGEQQTLLGANGPEAQQKSIAGIQSSPQFQAISQQGENAILQNASATGGLRGGNVQAALGQFRPQLLSQLIEQQYGRLGQMAGMGQASAAGQAAPGQQHGVNVATGWGQIGQAAAGNALAAGTANANNISALSQFGGSLAAMDWSKFGSGGSNNYSGLGGTSSGINMGQYLNNMGSTSGIGGKF